MYMYAYLYEKKTMKYLLTTVISLVALAVGYSQPFKDVPAHLHIEVAEERMAQGDYYNALEQYEEAFKQEQEDTIAYKIAMLHYQLRDFKRAERWLSRVIRKDETGQYPEAVLLYAKTLKMAGEYEEAVEALNVYTSMVDDEAKLAEADNLFAGLQFAMESEAPIELVIEHMGRKINSRYSEGSPTMHPDGKELYLSALPATEVQPVSAAPFSQVFKTEMGRRDDWEKPKALPDVINRPGYHTANPRFSEDGSRMYFTRALMEGDDLVESKIFVSNSNGTAWGAANEITAVNGDYIATHPTYGYLLGNAH